MREYTCSQKISPNDFLNIFLYLLLTCTVANGILYKNKGKVERGIVFMISETNDMLKVAWSGRSDLAILLLICAIFFALSTVISVYLYNRRKVKIEKAIGLIKQGYNKKIAEQKRLKRKAKKKEKEKSGAKPLI